MSLQCRASTPQRPRHPAHDDLCLPWVTSASEDDTWSARSRHGGLTAYRRTTNKICCIFTLNVCIFMVYICINYFMVSVLEYNTWSPRSRHGGLTVYRRTTNETFCIFTLDIYIFMLYICILAYAKYWRIGMYSTTFIILMLTISWAENFAWTCCICMLDICILMICVNIFTYAKYWLNKCPESTVCIINADPQKSQKLCEIELSWRDKNDKNVNEHVAYSHWTFACKSTKHRRTKYYELSSSRSIISIQIHSQCMRTYFIFIFMFRLTPFILSVTLLL